MRSLNRVFLMGYLGSAPELTTSKTGKVYSRLSLATHRSWMSDEDKREERTDWHSVFVWGALADRCVTNLRKGALVFVEGSLTYWKLTDQKKEYKNAVKAYEVKFLNPPKAASLAVAASSLPDSFAPPVNGTDGFPDSAAFDFPPILKAAENEMAEDTGIAGQNLDNSGAAGNHINAVVHPA
jgi:single-strand DNA-binding protein